MRSRPKYSEKRKKGRQEQTGRKPQSNKERKKERANIKEGQ